ncbi:MAG TPA: glutathione S-transferase [Alphaproteobacteria bacterium]|nr:glutathione S-transferase [Alphaproteobacteria bacterium]
MKLYYSGASPYVRKVMVTAIEAGVDKKVEQVPTAVMPTQPNKDLAKDNPLMKLPTLVTDDGVALFDSYVICEYLDSLNKGAKLIPTGPERWKVQTLHAVASGITDAGILCRYEEVIRKPEQRNNEWVQGQLAKVNNGLDELERRAKELEGPINLGQIAAACAIGWLEFRKPAGDIRKGRPKLFAWYDSFVKRPSLQATLPKA